MVEKSDEIEPRADASSDPGPVANNLIDVEAELTRLCKAVGAARARIGRQSAEGVLEMGGYLIEAKAIAGPKRRFHKWLRECRIAPRTADRYMERKRDYDALPEKDKRANMAHLPKLSYSALLKSIEPPEKKSPRPKPDKKPAVERPAEATEPGDLDAMWLINDPTVFAQELWDAVGLTRARAVYSGFGAQLRAEDEKWHSARPAEQDGLPDERDVGQVEVKEPRAIEPEIIEPEIIEPEVEEPPMTDAEAMRLACRIRDKFGLDGCRMISDALDQLREEAEAARAPFAWTTGTDRGARQTVDVLITPYVRPEPSYNDYPRNPSPVGHRRATRRNKLGTLVVVEEKD